MVTSADGDVVRHWTVMSLTGRNSCMLRMCWILPKLRLLIWDLRKNFSYLKISTVHSWLSSKNSWPVLLLLLQERRHGYQGFACSSCLLFPVDVCERTRRSLWRWIKECSSRVWHVWRWTSVLHLCHPPRLCHDLWRWMSSMHLSQNRSYDVLGSKCWHCSWSEHWHHH